VSQYALNVSSRKIRLQLVETFARLEIRQTDLTTTTHRSVADQVLDAVALEVAAAQEVPELVTVR